MSAFASGSSVLGGSRCGDCLPIRAPHLSRVAYSTLKSFPEAPALVLCFLQSPAALSPRSDSKEMLVRGSTHTTHPRSCQRANHARLSDGGAGVRRGVRCKAFGEWPRAKLKGGSNESASFGTKTPVFSLFCFWFCSPTRSENLTCSLWRESGAGGRATAHTYMYPAERHLLERLWTFGLLATYLKA